MNQRVVEAYVGEYASGKSELAINRALELLATGESVTLVDLDFVEPFYTLRPLVEELSSKGLNVIGWKSDEAFGLGEAGTFVKPAARWALWHPGHVILDVGYGVNGAASLNLVEGAYESPDLKVLAVVNVARPVTASVPDIIDFIRSLGRVDGLINNSHLGDDTDIKFVLSGLRLVNEAATILKIPFLYSVVTENLRDEALQAGIPADRLKTIHRYMPAAMW